MDILRRAYKNLGLFLTFIAATGCSTSMAQTEELTKGIDHIAIFNSMKQRIGTYYEKADEASRARVDYRLISRKSAIVETWYMPVGKEELTVFHMDNGFLVATHYCASGIQSTMVLENVDDEGVLHFNIRSATNLADNMTAHNSAFGYKLLEDGTIFRTETWTIKGVAQSSTLTLVPE